MDSTAPTAGPADAGPGPRLSVRVGVGWNPFGGDGLGDGRFWEAIEAMEELGYDSVWLADTAALPGAAPLPMLAAVAARTEKLKLGIGVLVLPPRNPVLLARELATVDVISGGRLLPAGGLGINIPAELEAMGVARGERVGRLEESVAIVKALWPGEPVTMRGRFWSLTDVRLEPRPMRRRLEFWLGGSTGGAAPREEDRRRLARSRRPRRVRRHGRCDPRERRRGETLDRRGPLRRDGLCRAERGRAARRRAPARGRRPDLSSRRPHRVRHGRAAFERFRAAGATKFVAIPIAELVPWLREMYTEAIEPFEAVA